MNTEKKLDKFLDVLIKACEEFIKEETKDNSGEFELELDATQLHDRTNAIFAGGSIGNVIFEFCSVLKTATTMGLSDDEIRKTAAAIEDVMNNIMKQNDIPFVVSITKV